jgi:HEAT repeat protein
VSPLFNFHSTAVPVLNALLSDSTEFDRASWMPRICDAAALALERIGTPEALTTLERWRDQSRK